MSEIIPVISATGLYTPSEIVTNEELVASFNTYVERFNERNAAEIEAGTVTSLAPSSVEFIEKASGIKSRHVMSKAPILDPEIMAPRWAERPDERADERPGEGSARLRIAVVAAPRISNLDEFQPLRRLAGVDLRWVRAPEDLRGADWVILPGSKHTSSDLAWLRARGLDAAIAAHAAAGRRVLGICGGLQMLGEALVDPHGIDGNAPGLGLLPLVTVFEPRKTVRRTRQVFGPVAGVWSALSGCPVSGYEIHHGQTRPHPAMAAPREVLPGGLGWQDASGRVLGVYVHGLFEQPEVLQALFGVTVPGLDTVFDGLADFVEAHLEPGLLERLAA